MFGGTAFGKRAWRATEADSSTSGMNLSHAKHNRVLAGGGFGQPAQQQPAAPAFGAPAASPFGGSTFGQPAQPAANPFGAATTATPLFGAQVGPTPWLHSAAPLLPAPLALCKVSDPCIQTWRLPTPYVSCRALHPLSDKQHQQPRLLLAPRLAPLGLERRASG